MKNPFYPVAEFPDFPSMTPDAAEEALVKLLAEANAAVDELEASAAPTWEGFVVALDDATRPVSEAWGLIGHLLSVSNSEAWRNLQAKFQGEIVTFYLRMGQSKKFYELAKSVKTDSPVRQRILDKTIQGAELSGVALADDKRERFNAIQAELARLGMDFRDHVLDATKSYSLLLEKEEDVAGLPEQVKSMIACEGGWRVTIEDAVYVPFMKHAKNRKAREELCKARSKRASCGREDNTPLIARILALREELAGLLGFKSYAELSLAGKTAPSVVAVYSMVDALDAAAAPKAREENAELEAFAKSDEKLEPWDIAFWSERQREAKYSYSEEELSKYFNFEDVLKGLFGLATRLFGVTIEECSGEAPVWHRDVRFFRVFDGNHSPVAHFYLDPYSRPETKSGGAWMNEFRTREVRADGKTVKPLAVICCNQVLPDENGIALMRFVEVETLFHEFGHALQHMLTTIDEAGASGLNLIEWDAVEVASQFMEYWCTDSVTLKSFAKHVKTGEPIPEELLAKVKAAKNYRAAAACERQLSFAVLDMVLHGGKGGALPKALQANAEKIHSALKAGDADEVKSIVFDAYTPGTTVEGDRFLNAFSHIFAGGYAAGYYGYKWSEVMCADIFGAFEEVGLDDAAAVCETGMRYRDTVLALGGSEDPMKVFEKFRGRQPSVEALLRQTGLLR